jgi:hypothetical protein
VQVGILGVAKVPVGERRVGSIRLMLDSKMRSTAAFLGLLLAGACWAQDTALISQDFKNDTAGWAGMGKAAKVSLTHWSPGAAQDGGALQFDYKVDRGEMDALFLPVGTGALAKAHSFKFRIMADQDTAVGVVLPEQDGGRYMAVCKVPKGVYQECELSPSDFHLSQEPGDPKDPDGKLDLDQVNGILLVDLQEIFVGAGNADLEKLLNVQKGAHSLYLDRFSVVSEAAPTTSETDKGVTTLDTFRHPQLAWIGVGAVKMSLSRGEPLAGPGMKWDYKQMPNSFVAGAVGIEPGILRGKDSLSFDLASVRGGTMRVQLEEVGGNKYSTSVDIPFGSKVKHVALQFSDFRSTDDTKDPMRSWIWGR